MDPKFCHNGCQPKGQTLTVRNQLREKDGIITHFCHCSTCGEDFIVEQTIEQWRRD